MSVFLILSNDEIAQWVNTLLSSTAQDGKFLKALSRFKELKGYGIECISIFFYSDFEEWDEYRCDKHSIALSLCLSGKKEIGYMPLSQFYGFIISSSEEHCKKFPQDQVEVSRLLEEIKIAFKLNNKTL